MKEGGKERMEEQNQEENNVRMKDQNKETRKEENEMRTIKKE